MFIHGAWVTPRCWDLFRSYYEQRGHTCLAPAWPYDDRPPRELRATPRAELSGLGVSEIVSHYEKLIRDLPEPPIIVGHSFGGLFVQLLLDRGFGAAGIAIDPGPPRWIFPTPTAFRAALFVFLKWAGWRRAVTMPFTNFQWGFAHNLSPDEQRLAYENHVVPTPGRIYYQLVLGIHTRVNFSNGRRGPLLLIGGGDDRTAPPSMTRAMYRKHRRSSASTKYLEFPGRTHWLIASPGWEEIAMAIESWVNGLS
ncbi:MAG: alpha/beta hydrolase [Burkholderiaceae bacterium]